MHLLIIRYGSLLAVFIILLEWLRHTNIMSVLPLDIYIGITALFGVLVGSLFMWRLISQQKSTPSDELTPTRLASLSPRENDVLTFLVHGYSNKEIASNLELSENTIKSHLKNIYTKLGVSNRTQAAAEAKLLSLIHNPT